LLIPYFRTYALHTSRCLLHEHAQGCTVCSHSPMQQTTDDNNNSDITALITDTSQEQDCPNVLHNLSTNAFLCSFREKWTEVFEVPNLSLDSLKARALSQQSNLGIDGIRSVCWKVNGYEGSHTPTTFIKPANPCQLQTYIHTYRPRIICCESTCSQLLRDR
jgi:hypothetical protein